MLRTKHRQGPSSTWTIGVSRGAVRRHLQAPESVVAAFARGSQCEPFRELIVAKCDRGLSAKRIHQDLVADHGFDDLFESLIAQSRSQRQSSFHGPAGLA